jgi:PAS domain S-box-containing protein
MMDLSNPRLFETVLDSLEAGVYLVDRHRKIVYWNHGAERISGYLRQDVNGRGVPLRDEDGRITGAIEIFEERRVEPDGGHREDTLGKLGCLGGSP